MSSTTFNSNYETIAQIPKKDINAVQGDWNAKVGKDAQADWGGLLLLEFATFNNLVLTNTLGPQNHPEDGHS